MKYEKPNIEIKHGILKINGEQIDTVYGIDVHYEVGGSGRATVTLVLDAIVEIEGQAEQVKREGLRMDKDIILEDLCKKLSNHLFNTTEKYDPYSKVIITGTSIEVVQGVQSISVKR